MDYDIYVFVGWHFTEASAWELINKLSKDDPVMTCEMEEKDTDEWLYHYFGKDFVCRVGEHPDEMWDYHVGSICSKANVSMFIEYLKDAEEELKSEFAKYLDLLGPIEVICSH
ncbi:hypothetical protein BNJ_00175 [Kaumoebavirus]|uniref:hypothetical protein n=1 Tax=Kaumoebavirus TaxID=1859492 RepID=UPI0009C38941|nr:hypothetical protein BNJ_00175 [Kaumoebavirus]ARA72006.1 hypothetical protein BNJ_00175 [Kaumoebavirus]